MKIDSKLVAQEIHWLRQEYEGNLKDSDLEDKTVQAWLKGYSACLDDIQRNIALAIKKRHPGFRHSIFHVVSCGNRRFT